jgi:hypothetical protein
MSGSRPLRSYATPFARKAWWPRQGGVYGVRSAGYYLRLRHWIVANPQERGRRLATTAHRFGLNMDFANYRAGASSSPMTFDHKNRFSMYRRSTTDHCFGGNRDCGGETCIGLDESWVERRAGRWAGFDRGVWTGLSAGGEGESF